MANKKIRLQNLNGDILYPRTSLDNIVATVDSEVAVSIPTLTDGKIPVDYLPSYVDDVIELLTIAATAPSTCAVGDKYFNSTTGNLKIYTATAANTWGATGETPVSGVIYINLANETTHRWSGTAMVEISKQVATTPTVRAAASATDTVVPTEKAVRTAISGAAYSLPTASASVLGGVKIGTNISIASGVISVANGSTSAKGVVQLKSSIAAAASAVDTLAPTEKAVRTALDTKQDSLTEGKGIDITSGTVSIVTCTEVAAAGQGGYVPDMELFKTQLNLKQNTLTPGTNISISSGTISNTYSLPTASASTLGGVKIGSNISISSGVISVADASASAKGVVKLTGATIGATPSTALAVTEKLLSDELAKKQGTLTAGTNISISSGTISNTYSYSLPTATASVLGGVKIGTNISISSGIISVATANGTTKGIVGVGANNYQLQIVSGVLSAITNDDIANAASSGAAQLTTAGGVKSYVEAQIANCITYTEIA